MIWQKNSSSGSEPLLFSFLALFFVFLASITYYIVCKEKNSLTFLTIGAIFDQFYYQV
jgi:hypothetical protein